MAAACLLGSGCGGSSTSPTQVVPPPQPDPLRITCPAPVTQQSSTGEAIPVNFNAPTTTGGTAPIQVACNPVSGSVFPIGSKTVTCTATDSKSVTDQCSFTVTLTAPPKITQTSFAAFGDSMTNGEVISEGTSQGIRTLRVDRPKSYPTDLQTLLQSRYVSQADAIQVYNAGVSGETTSGGWVRLPSITDGGQYKVLLLMEGVNDFPDYQTALGNMQTMVRYAKRRSEITYLATVPPENPNPQPLCYANQGKNWAFVDPYNAGLRSIAAAENVTLVDVNGAFNGDLTLIDCDGLHPTPQGYQLIATTFFNAIKSTLEIPSTSTTANPTRTLTQPFVAPQRRGIRR